MAIQTINLAVPGGDTPRSANTKINANFTDQDNAASRKVGASTGDLMEMTGRGLGGYGYGNNRAASVDADSSVVGKAGGFYCYGGTVTDATPYQAFIHLPYSVTNNAAQIGVVVTTGAVKVRYTSGGGWRDEITVYTTRNTSKDSNGFIKAASPIVKVFADKVELNEDAVNQNVTYKKNGVGDYTITTVSGLSTDGWYIELPKDMNGNPKVAVTLSEVDGVISLKSYKRIFSMETFTFEPDLEQPLDVPDGRWIDLRLNELPIEPPQESSADAPAQPTNP